MRFLFLTKTAALVFIAGSSLLLAACVARTDNTIVQQNQLLAHSLSPSVLNKTVIAGQTIEVITTSNVNPDCTSNEPGTIRITQQPAHGSAMVSQRDVYPSFPPGNPRAVCNTKKVPGIALYYTASSGFTGSDLMAFELFTRSGGDSNEIKVIITVK